MGINSQTILCLLSIHELKKKIDWLLIMAAYFQISDNNRTRSSPS